MSRLVFSDEFSGSQPASGVEPQKVDNFQPPSKKNGWLVQGTVPVRSWAVALRDDPNSHRNYTPERGKSVASEYHAAPVTLAKLEWPSKRFRTETK